MKKSVVWAGWLLAAAACGAFGGAVDAPGIDPDQHIVVLKRGADPDAVVKRHGVAADHVYTHALNGFAGRIPPGQRAKLAADPDVAYIEKDIEAHAVAQTLPTGVDRIDADLNAVAKINGVDERVAVDIAIIDTGIDLDHPDLNVVVNKNFIITTKSGNDDNGHGSHVAGTVAAIDNGSGVVGVAPGARLWALKVLDRKGNGYFSDAIEAIDFVTANAASIEVANMSLSGIGKLDSLRTALQNSVAAGVVYVVAAGNESRDVYGPDGVLGTSDDSIPAAYPEVATISAMADSDGQAGGLGGATGDGDDDTVAAFSNRSAYVDVSNPVASLGKAIDLAAPGCAIQSTYKNGGYATGSGTSMASPHVAGAVALYIAEHGRATNAAGVYAIRQALINAAQPQTAWGPADTNDPDGNPEGLVSVASATSNHPPVAGNDSYTVAADGQLSTSAPSLPGVLANDTDADGDPLTAVVLSDVSHGLLALNPDGSFLYIPTAGYGGSDSFTYRANDGVADSNVATVTIQVLSPYRIPDAELRDTAQFVKLWGEPDSLIESRQDVAGGGELYSIKLGANGDGKIGIGDDWALGPNLGLDWDDGLGHWTSLAGYGCYEMAVSYSDGPPGSSIKVCLYLNTGLTGPSGSPSLDNTNNTYWECEWVTIAQGETKTLRLDFNCAFAAVTTGPNILDNKAPHTGGDQGWDDGKWYAINDRDRHELSNIGLQVIDAGDGTTLGQSIEVVLNGTAPTPPELHDVAVAAIGAPASVGVGDVVSVVVTVANEGNQTETFEVTLTDATAGTPIGAQPVGELAPGQSRDLTFEWNTAGAALGAHTLRAQASSVTGETDLADNTRDQVVTVTEASPVTQIHVAAFAVTRQTAGANTYAVATVRIVDSGGLPVEGATVAVEWTGSAPGTSSGLTNAAGEVALSSSKLKKPKTATFTATLTAVAKDGCEYDPVANEVPPPITGTVTVP